MFGFTLSVQVPNNHILKTNLYYNYYYHKPKYLIIGYLDPLGTGRLYVCGLAGNSVEKLLALPQNRPQ